MDQKFHFHPDKSWQPSLFFDLNARSEVGASPTNMLFAAMNLGRFTEEKGILAVDGRGNRERE